MFHCFVFLHWKSHFSPCHPNSHNLVVWKFHCLFFFKNLSVVHAIQSWYSDQNVSLCSIVFFFILKTSLFSMSSSDQNVPLCSIFWKCQFLFFSVVIQWSEYFHYLFIVLKISLFSMLSSQDPVIRIFHCPYCFDCPTFCALLSWFNAFCDSISLSKISMLSLSLTICKLCALLLSLVNKIEKCDLPLICNGWTTIKKTATWKHFLLSHSYAMCFFDFIINTK